MSNELLEEYGDNFSPRRVRIRAEVGSLYLSNDNVFKLTELLDFESAIGIDIESGRSKALRIAELEPLPDDQNDKAKVFEDIDDIADKDWAVAQKRFSAIKPLIDDPDCGRAEVEARAKELGKSTATLYRWLRAYKGGSSISSLIPQARGWSLGKKRISPETESIIQEVIENFFLKPQRPNHQMVVVEVQRQCHIRGIEKPSSDTIRSRLHDVSEKRQLRGRGFADLARKKFTPTPGTFPDADYPLAVVQIDHTPMDIIVVDDVNRKPIGRPWVTVAIDVYSRTITGYYLSLDPPSQTSVGLCVAHSILPKDEWLLLHDVDAEWPIFGFPQKIHVDNGADFQSDNFERSCLMHKINLEFRPVKRPRYGGHIERLLGNFMEQIHGLPGTTFSSVSEKSEYKSETNAVMTMSELERWLVLQICKVYHQKMHSTIGMKPLRQWEIGIFGNSETVGVGPPEQAVDRGTVMLDFLPSYHRTIQPFGVKIDQLNYYSEALRPWINARQTDDRNKKRQFIFRRDPRDISMLWFFDPTIKQYFQVPFADQSLPSMSIWEHKQARAKLLQEGKESINEGMILDAITELREQVDKASAKTKKARRSAQRRKIHAKKITPDNPVSTPSIEPSNGLEKLYPDLIDGDFDDLEEIV